MLTPGLAAAVLALFAQPPTITLKGRAVDTTGAGLQLVSVTPWVSGQRQSSLQSPAPEDGRFVVTGIPADTVLLEISSLGFLPNRCHVGQLTPGETIELPEVTLQVAPLCGLSDVPVEVDPLPAALDGIRGSNAIIKGRVVDRFGRPLKGVTVSIAELSAPGPLLRIPGNESSNFRFGDLPAGNYLLEFSLPGFTTERRTIQLNEAGVLELPPVQLGVSGKIVCASPVRR